MRSNLMKFFAIVLAAILLTMAVLGGIAMVFLIEQELYEQPADQRFLEVMTYKVAYNYALEQAALSGGMTPEEAPLLDTMYVPYYISDRVLQVQPDAAEPIQATGVYRITHTVQDLLYPVVLAYGEEMPDADTQPVYSETQYLYLYDEVQAYTLLYYPAPPMTVTVTMSGSMSPEMALTALVYRLRNFLLPAVLGGAVLGLLCLVYLCWAAGRKKGQEEIVPGGLNRLPLDLYALAVFLLLVTCAKILVHDVLYSLYAAYYLPTALLSAVLIFFMFLPAIGWLFAFAAQVKADGFWWRHSVIGWSLLKVVCGIRRCRRGLRAVFRLLPVVWQWLLTAAMMGLALLLTGIPAFLAYSYIRPIPFFVFLFLMVLLGCIAAVLYGAYCFGTILKAAKEMAGGDLGRKVNTKNLLAAFRDCGDNLNALSDAAMESARQQMKSERMKTELIANVSHDIKTPLTSIVNYVDLMQKPHSDEENAQYLEVLSRQCGRLKKLTEDLVEMSKATTGNITAELTPVDACETLRQALGEFSDKLEAAQLNVVLCQPEEPMMMLADGRLTWRVLSNLLSNAVKYAMPGTRLYADVAKKDSNVLISLKNMSREQLNITADELMERFVRGDAARHTEGSGLGLSIAKGLMESQGGTLQLLTDGDLFKVTLTFPADSQK